MHGHAEEGVGHVGGPDGGAHDVVDQEAGAAGHQSAQEHAAAAAGKQAGQTQNGKGQKIVADDGLPADGEAAVKHELQHAEQEAVQQAGAKAPAHRVQYQRHHGQNDTAAPGHLPQLDVAEDLGYGQKHGTLAEGADLHVIHNLYLQKKFPHGEPCRRHNAEISKADMFAFLRRHYPDQVRGIRRQYVLSQPACASTPWIVGIS